MREIRVSIFAATTVLIAVGVVMIYSTSAIYAYENLGDSLFFLKRHLLYMAAGIPAMFFSMSFDYRALKRYSRILILISAIFLLLVLIPKLGTEVGGARRWFRVHGFSFQPSELAKMTLIIYMADFLTRKGPAINDIGKSLLPLAAVVGTIAGLILAQPDLGTVILVCVLTLLLLFSANLRSSYIIGLFLASLPLFYVLVLSVPYRLNRIKVFLNPWQDPKGTGFQMIQSLTAIGSGGILGVGLGMSKQKLFYLPEAHTDFIFSIIAEELGLLGSLSITVLFFVLIWQGMRIVFKAEDLFGRFLSLGVVSMIALEVLINIGVTIGAIPTKGLPLPFVSYGGTALFFHMMAVGLLLNVAKKTTRL